MLKTLAAAAIALTAIISATPAQAGSGWWAPNGVSLNGVQLNSLTTNGIGLNGTKVNSTSSQGSELRGSMQVLAIELPAAR